MTEPATLFKLAEEMRRETENVINRLHRHCRIGRVTKKVMIHGGKMVLLKRWLPDPNKPVPLIGFFAPTTAMPGASRVTSA